MYLECIYSWSFRSAISSIKISSKAREGEMRVAVWPMSWCMEDSVRSNFDKRGKETMIPNVLWSLYCGATWNCHTCMEYSQHICILGLQFSNWRKIISYIWYESNSLPLRLETQRNSKWQGILYVHSKESIVCDPYQIYLEQRLLTNIILFYIRWYIQRC
jgi:hypothetical protein